MATADQHLKQSVGMKGTPAPRPIASLSTGAGYKGVMPSKASINLNKAAAGKRGSKRK